MARKPRLIVGLGNPGEEYAHTRHNIGFDIVDAIARKTRVSFKTEEEGLTARLATLFKDSLLASETSGAFRGSPFVLLKPLTYMNRSGRVVKRTLDRLQLDPLDVIVIFDDISLPCGLVRLRRSGGAGGHNGVQDIIDSIGTDAFPRIRIGIGNDYPRGGQSDYVLDRFSADQQPFIDAAVPVAVDSALCYLRDGITTAMNRFNRKPVPPVDPGQQPADEA